MKKIIAILITILSTGSLVAVPRFALMEDVSCGVCHSYGGGGAGRTSYGKDYVRETLVMKDMALPWLKEESEFPIYVGLDTRYQMIAESDKDLRKFPMQLALYASAEFGNLVSHAEVVRISDEFRFSGGIRYEGLPLESWVSLSKAMPVLGWRIDDHSVFTRGGNLTKVGLDREGMPYTPFLKSPVLFELGTTPIMGLEVSVMAGSPFIAPDTETDVSVFSALKVNYMYSGDRFIAHAGLAIMDENELFAGTVASWGISSGKLVWLGEISEMDGWPRMDISNIAVLHQLSYRVVQGVDIVGRYEFFDPESETLNGAIQRNTLGLELFPIPGIEVKLSYRQSQLDLPESTPEPESQFLSQVHLYF